jgi:hypothetical protein
MASPEEVARTVSRIRTQLEELQPPYPSPFVHQHHLRALDDTIVEMGEERLLDVDPIELTHYMRIIMLQRTLSEQHQVLGDASQLLSPIDAEFLQRWHRFIAGEVWPSRGPGPTHTSALRDPSTMELLREFEEVERGLEHPQHERLIGYPGPDVASPATTDIPHTPSPPPVDQRVTREMTRRAAST